MRKFSGNQLFLKELNTVSALRAIRSRGLISRAELANMLGLNRSTITAIVNRLIESQLVIEAGQGQSSGGRPPTQLRFNHEAAYAACVEWSAERIGIYICDLGGEVLFSRELDRDMICTPLLEISEAAEVLRAAVESLPGKPHGVLGVALGVPGVVDSARGTVSSFDLGWDVVPLAARFQEAFDMPVFVEHIATLGLTAELGFGEAIGEEHICYVRLRQGITAGILHGGRILRGALGFAGNVGHTVIEAHGVPCACGNRGCWTNYASDEALLRSHAKKNRSTADWDSFLRLLREGDPAARQSFRTHTEYLGIGIANLVNMLNPSAIVIDSALNELGSPFIEALQPAVGRAALPHPYRHVKLRLSSLGHRAVVLGGIALIFDRNFAPPNVKQL